MISGKIVFYHERKDYGFVEVDEIEEDIFFSLKEFSEGQPYLNTISDVEEGENVLIEYERRDKGPIVSSMIKGRICEKHDTDKIYHDTKEKWFCPFCTEPSMVGDYAPTVYDKDGNPMKVRIVGAKCEGDVSGEGHYGYIKQKEEAEEPTIYFEKYDGN